MCVEAQYRARSAAADSRVQVEYLKVTFDLTPPVVDSVVFDSATYTTTNIGNKLTVKVVFDENVDVLAAATNPGALPTITFAELPGKLSVGDAAVVATLTGAAAVTTTTADDTKIISNTNTLTFEFPALAFHHGYQAFDDGDLGDVTFTLGSYTIEDQAGNALTVSTAFAADAITRALADFEITIDMTPQVNPTWSTDSSNNNVVTHRSLTITPASHLVGETATPTYTAISWYISDQTAAPRTCSGTALDAPPTAFTGTTSSTRALTTADVGKWICATVTLPADTVTDSDRTDSSKVDSQRRISLAWVQYQPDSTTPVVTGVIANNTLTVYCY